jgi:TatD DNase family protein
LLQTVSKPLVLHIVRAHGQAISILQPFRAFLRGGIVHSFSGNRENAKRYLDLGLSLSISGGIARRGFESLKKAVAYIPNDRLLVETDSPDQSIAGVDARELNEPTALLEIARVLAGFRGAQSAEEILKASTLNAERIFK